MTGMLVREYCPADAESIIELYNGYPDTPNPVRGGITAEQFRTELDERGTRAFLVALDDDRVVGTFGMFSTNGRHSVGRHEAFADMFFVSPAYRCSVFAGMLFSAAVEAMFSLGVHVMRLTVNPANAAAFKLYRRVGCVNISGHGPGEDANIELHNFIPLILHAVRENLGEEEIRPLSEMKSFGCVTTPLGDQLTADTISRDGRNVVDYRLTHGSVLISATVDVDSTQVLRLSVTHGTSTRTIEMGAPAVLDAIPPSQPVVSDGSLQVSVDRSGVLAITHPNHLGPLLITTWPSPVAHQVTGWRQGCTSQLSGRCTDRGLEVSDEYGISCTIRIEGNGVVHDFSGPVNGQLRLFQQCGLRRGFLSGQTADGETIDNVAVGLDVGVRDSSEVAAAGLRLEDGTPVIWREGGKEVCILPAGRTSLVHSALVDRRLTLDSEGQASLKVIVSPGSPSCDENFGDLPELSADATSMVIDPEAGGVTIWRDGSAKILRSPWPRSQRLGANPAWRSGLWVTREDDRHNRRYGMGWGMNGSTWSFDGDAMTTDSDDLCWAISGGSDTGWTLDITCTTTRGELVMWLTPATAAEGLVMATAHGTTTELGLGSTWQRWSSQAAIPLRHGHWLLVEPDTSLSECPELLLRSTNQGLLIGCVSRAARLTASWRLFVTQSLPVQASATVPAQLSSDSSERTIP